MYENVNSSEKQKFIVVRKQSSWCFPINCEKKSVQSFTASVKLVYIGNPLYWYLNPNKVINEPE